MLSNLRGLLSPRKLGEKQRGVTQTTLVENPLGMYMAGIFADMKTHEKSTKCIGEYIIQGWYG